MFRFFTFVIMLFASCMAWGQVNKKQKNSKQEYIALRVYHATDQQQLNRIDAYLQQVFLPALERNKLKNIGVFTAIGNDTATDKRIYVLVPLQSVAQLVLLDGVLKMATHSSAVDSSYINAPHNQPPYSRFETILMRAFSGMPKVKASSLKSNKSEQVYELRSYESATEALHQNKVAMFNNGEIQLFDRLGFGAVFYGQVIVGSKMPNLMYITSFENKADRDAHWKTFGNHPDWKVMSAKPEYQNNVSKIDIVFLTPTAYSRL